MSDPSTDKGKKLMVAPEEITSASNLCSERIADPPMVCMLENGHDGGCLFMCDIGGLAVRILEEMAADCDQDD